MDHKLQSKADELIRALGALGLAQESAPHAPEVAALTLRAEQLHEAIKPTSTENSL